MDARHGTAAAAGTWTLGDLTVNRIGFGSMRLTSERNGTPTDRRKIAHLLRRALDLGVNHIDTAAFYFSARRSANELINHALAPYPADLVITTKVGPGRDASGEWLPLARPDQLRGQVEENLRQLGRDHLDVVNLRQAGLTSIAEHFGALADLRTAGLIRHLGLSNIRPHHLDEALLIAPVVCVQNPYGIDYRRNHDGFVDACGAQGVAFVPFFAIAAAGREAGVQPTENEVIVSVAHAHDATPAQVRLAWTLQRGPHVLAIPGTSSIEHLEENVQAGQLLLTSEEFARLNTVAQPVGE